MFQKQLSMISNIISDLFSAIENGYTSDFNFLHDGTLIDTQTKKAVVCQYTIDALISDCHSRSTLLLISTADGLRGSVFQYWDIH
jgi:hypothetical protein